MVRRFLAQDRLWVRGEKKDGTNLRCRNSPPRLVPRRLRRPSEPLGNHGAQPWVSLSRPILCAKMCDEANVDRDIIAPVIRLMVVPRPFRRVHFFLAHL
jgi:hypothetical protein